MAMWNINLSIIIIIFMLKTCFTDTSKLLYGLFFNWGLARHFTQWTQLFLVVSILRTYCHDCFALYCRGGTIVLVSSVGGYVPFSVSIHYVNRCMFKLFLKMLFYSGSWSIFCEQDCFNWIDKSLSSGTCSRQYSSQLYCTRLNPNQI